MHYIDILTKQFNKDLLSDQQQLSFIPHAFSDEDRLAELVQTMLALLVVFRWNEECYSYTYPKCNNADDKAIITVFFYRMLKFGLLPIF